MAFDKALKEVGEFGLFQKVFIFGFLQLSMILIATAYWTQVYILVIAPHRCKTGHDDNSWTRTNMTNSTPIVLHQCHLNISHSDHFSNESEQTSCPYDWVYDYSDLYPTFSSEHDWVCENSWKIYASHTCYWIGGVVGFLLFGSLSDRFGRKKSFIICVIILILSDVGTFFTFDFKTFLAARFFSALGATNLGTCCFVLAIEYTGPKYRIFCFAVWSLSYTFTTTILPWIVYAVADWHYVLCISWVVALFSLFVTSFIPESSSWLMTRGRVEDAARCMQRIAKFNGKHISLYRIKEMLLDEHNMSSLGEAQQNGEMVKENEDKEIKQMSFLRGTIGLFRTPNMRKKTILLIIIWMLCTMCYLGNSLETSNLPWSFRLSYSVVGIAELPANIICLLSLDRIGRRWANVIFFTVGGVFGIIAGSFVKNAATVVVLVWIMRMCNAANYDLIFTMSSELFPTVVRGRGVTIVRTFGGLANTISPFIFALSEHDKLLPLVVYGVLCVIGGVLTLFLPEPAGRHLPHTLEEGEEFGKDQSFFYCPFQRRQNSVKALGMGSMLIDEGRDVCFHLCCYDSEAEIQGFLE